MLGTPMLTDAQIRKAKAADKPYKLTDGAGLHVFVTPAGGKLWRLRYEFERKEKLLSIGPYPSVGVAEARGVVANAKRLLREGKDPAVEKRLRRLQVVTDGGTIAGGTRANVVAEHASAEIDMQVPNPEIGDRAIGRVLAIKAYDPDCTLEISGGLNRPGYPGFLDSRVKTTIFENFETERRVGSMCGSQKFAVV
jgi:hypothetical protein